MSEVEIEEIISAWPTPEAAGRGPQPPLLRAARSLADRPRWGNRQQGLCRHRSVGQKLISFPPMTPPIYLDLSHPPGPAAGVPRRQAEDGRRPAGVGAVQLRKMRPSTPQFFSFPPVSERTCPAADVATALGADKVGQITGLEKSEKRGVQAARNGPSEDNKCWQRIELGIHGLNR